MRSGDYITLNRQTYCLDALLSAGAGSYGQVWAATDPAGRAVALKFINTEAMAQAQQFMRDFSRIRAGGEDGGALFTPQHAAELFDANARWLARELAQPFAGPTVVVTHHAPSPHSIHPRFAGSPINAAFVSDAQALVEGSGARLWVHGHTHDSFDYRLHSTRVLCNPRGYAKDGQVENARFNPHLVVEVA